MQTLTQQLIEEGLANRVLAITSGIQRKSFSVGLFIHAPMTAPDQDQAVRQRAQLFHPRPHPAWT